MPSKQSEWLFNLALRLAVIVCLSTLALGLMMGIDPLIALFRSSIAFIAFAILAWAAGLVWYQPDVQEIPVQSEHQEEGVENSGSQQLDATRQG